MIAATPTRRASRATLPARGRDESCEIVAMHALINDHAATPSLPFTGRVAREARRVAFDPAPGKVG
jgi:hypothetical protein